MNYIMRYDWIYKVMAESSAGLIIFKIGDLRVIKLDIKKTPSENSNIYAATSVKTLFDGTEIVKFAKHLGHEREIRTAYIKEGFFHREDGPALLVEHLNIKNGIQKVSEKNYYLNGIKYDSEKYLENLSPAAQTHMVFRINELAE